MEGQVKWFNRRKGYGFIQGEDNVEYFVHNSAIAQGTFIRENDKVSFDAAETEKGKQAQNVVLLQKGSETSQEDAPEQAQEAAEEPKEEAQEETKEEAAE